MTRVSEQPSRWSKATLYPDMWVDPDEDPRNSDGVSPDGELATLQDYLSDYRLTLRMKCEGLDAEQLARRSVPPSTMSLLGLLRHLAEVERDWRNWITSGDPLPKLYGEGDADFDGAVAEQTVVDAAYADLDREQAATDAMLAKHPDLGERLGKDGIAVRELLVHRIEEYARHCRARRPVARMHRRPRRPVRDGVTPASHLCKPAETEPRPAPDRPDIDRSHSGTPVKLMLGSS
jgi:uncharacterized damage-inducible protein DinB